MDLKLHPRSLIATTLEKGLVRRQGLLQRIVERRKRAQLTGPSPCLSERP